MKLQRLIVGWRVCTDEIVAKGQCHIPASTWSSSSNMTIQLRVSSVNITTWYSLDNSSILQAAPTGTSILTPISSNDVFSVLETMLNTSDTNPIASQMILTLVSFLRSGNLGGKAAWKESDLLRSLLAFPLHWVS